MIQGLIAELLAQAGHAASQLAQSGNLVRTPTGTYFAQTARSPAAQLRGEAASLQAMALTAPAGLVPRCWTKERDGERAMLSEYAEGGGGRRMRQLGERLARMHRVPEDTGSRQLTFRPKSADYAYTGRYGFGVPTHCGATQQDNTWEADWATFFRERRLGDLVRRLGDGQITAAWERLSAKAVPLLLEGFDPPAKPVPLHGDLWAGNVAHTSKGGVIFDPAGYYGHGEADLGIARMFGGFSGEFFDAYHSVNPRSQPYYDQRQRLYELYHHLNHALMFGGYRQGALGIMRELSELADSVE